MVAILIVKIYVQRCLHGGTEHVMIHTSMVSTIMGNTPRSYDNGVGRGYHYSLKFTEIKLTIIELNKKLLLQSFSSAKI